MTHDDHPASARRHWWLPNRIGWWVGVLFTIGSGHFVIGGFFSTWAHALAWTPSGSTLAWVFFVGSLFFTAAAWLQVVKVANGDVAAVGTTHPRRWFGWLPHNLGWLAGVTQLIGTVTFNFSTGDAMISGLAWEVEDVVVWTPDIVGCVCFLVASGLAWLEYSHGWWSFAPRSVSWWIVALNVAGSAAFFASGVFAYVSPGPPDPEKLWLNGLFTFVGAVCFLVGSVLLLPEQADA